MAAAYNSAGHSSTVTEYNTNAGIDEQVSSGVVRLKLGKATNSKKVSWTNDTVDNEHLGKKKSKCCCVYVKPRKYDESSSSESDGECENCTGHVDHTKNTSEQTENKGDPTNSQME